MACGRHDGAGGEAVEVLALDGPVDDGDVGGAGGAADGAGDVRVDGERAGGVDVGLAGEREHVGEVGVAHRGVELEGSKFSGFQLRSPTEPVKLACSAPRVRTALRERRRRSAEALRSAAKRVKVRSSTAKLVSSAWAAMRGALSLPVTVALTVAEPPLLSATGMLPQRAEVVEVARDDAGLDLLAERAGEIDARVRQLDERLAEQDGVGAAVVVDVELAGDRHAAASGSDAEVGVARRGVGILEIAVGRARGRRRRRRSRAASP